MPLDSTFRTRVRIWPGVRNGKDSRNTRFRAAGRTSAVLSNLKPASSVRLVSRRANVVSSKLEAPNPAGTFVDPGEYGCGGDGSLVIGGVASGVGMLTEQIRGFCMTISTETTALHSCPSRLFINWSCGSIFQQGNLLVRSKSTYRT